ncbi:hypothetical protein VB005_06219 [Metarhizium brunneum]
MRLLKADGRIKVPDVNDNGGNRMSIASTSVASRAAVANTGIAALAISDMPLLNPDFRGPVISSHKLTWTTHSSKALDIDGKLTLTVRGSNDTSRTVSLAACVLRFNVGEDEDKGCLCKGGSKFQYRSGGPLVPQEVEGEKKEEQDDEPKPEDTVTLTRSPDVYTTTATINSPKDTPVVLAGPNPAPEPTVVPWEIEVQSGGFWGEAMNVPPGAWFQLDITGAPAAPEGGPKLVRVNEKTQDKAGKIIAEWEKEYQADDRELYLPILQDESLSTLNDVALKYYSPPDDSDTTTQQISKAVRPGPLYRAPTTILGALSNSGILTIQPPAANTALPYKSNLSSLTTGDATAVQKTLTYLLRLHALVTDAEDLPALLDAGFTSARSIALTSQSNFTNRLSSSAISNAKLAAIHRESQRIDTRSDAIWADIVRSRREILVLAVTGIKYGKDYPETDHVQVNLDTLFRDLDSVTAES